MGIGAYVGRRLALSLVVIAGVTVVTFLLALVIPGNPAIRWAGPRAPAEQVARAREELRLDDSIPVRYVNYMAGFLRGDWGTSIRTRQPVLRDIATYLPATLELVLFSMLIAVVVGIPLGAFSAAMNGRWADHLARLLSIGGVAVPAFWLAMILQLVVAKELNLLPLQGRIDTMTRVMTPIRSLTGFHLFDALVTGNFAGLWSAFRHMILPAVTLAVYPLGLAVRMTRGTLLEVLGEDYIRSARAQGVGERKLLLVYALKNALGPVLTVLALTFAYSLTGTFLVESVFSWPGLGNYAAKAIPSADYPAIMGITVLIAVSYVTLNLLVDLIMAVLDPRIRVK